MKLAACPFCGTHYVDVRLSESCHYARVICNNPTCGAKGPLSVMRVGPEWREVVEESAVTRWNEAACRCAGWMKV